MRKKVDIETAERNLFFIRCICLLLVILFWYTFLNISLWSSSWKLWGQLGKRLYWNLLMWRQIKFHYLWF